MSRSCAVAHRVGSDSCRAGCDGRRCCATARQGVMRRGRAAAVAPPARLSQPTVDDAANPPWFRKESSRVPSRKARIVGAPREDMCVTESPSAAAQRLLVQAAEALIQVTGSGSDVELVALLSTCETVVRRLDRAAVNAVAVLERRGVFAERGYKSAAAALSDLLGWERFEARRRVVAAEQVTPRVGLDGAALPARLAGHRRGVRCRGGVPAARRDHRPRAGSRRGRAAVAAAVGRGGGPARREGRPVHPVGAAGLGHGAGRGAGPGRRGARRPACGRGERAAPDPIAVRGREDQGPVRRRGDVRRDRRGGRRQGPPVDRRRRPPGLPSGRPRRWRMCAATSWTTPRRRCCPSAADGARTSPCWSGWRICRTVPGRRAWTSAARSHPSRCACSAATPRSSRS